MLSQPPVRTDPVTLEVIRNALPAITNEMSYDLQRTSYNMMIYEVRDYCCALLDAEGRLLSQNMGGVSHFVADLGVVIKDSLRQYGLDGFAPGDVLITNHQRVAGQHLNNMCVYTPIFWEGQLFGFAIVRAHWVDVGGASTGFGAGQNVTDPWMEGMQIDQLKVYERGQADRKLLKLIADNIRFPESSLGDFRSQLAACRLAERRVEELLRRYGRDTLSAAIETIFDETEAKCRAVVAQMPDGEYSAESFLDPDRAEPDKPIDVKVRVLIEGDHMTIDLTGCAPQRKGALNSRTLAGAYIAYKGITTPLEPVNEGSFRALKVVIQEGNIMMATFPATMAGWSRPLPTVVDTVLTALAPAMKDRVPAAHLGALGGALVFFGTDPRSGKGFVLQSIEGGGWGGRPWEDGPSASVSVCQGDVRNAPIENIELKVPVIVKSRELRQDSGGAGTFRGGLGVATRVQNLVEGRWNLAGAHERGLMPPWGLWGGQSGKPAGSLLKLPGEADFKPVHALRHLVPAGSEVITLVAGGGGWGNPLERDVALVQADLIDGLISPESALADYGVVADPRTLEIDLEATAERRLRAGRT
jgi:N-methylhydantoinase B